MTRDEAINAVEALRLKDPGEHGGHADGGIRNLVDTLAALGVLKLDAVSNFVVVDTEHEKGRKAAAAGFLRSNNPYDELVYGAGSVDETIRQEKAAAWYAGFDSYSKSRCVPPPEHREKRWHWLRDGATLVCGRWQESEWRIEAYRLSPVMADRNGYSYVAPCEEPKP